ncbi:MAG: ABC transporter substrate-binding protein [Candidatus Parcubacteria bacterium]|nr:ABC transporter substrate-binding protein [Candidatus Parcubacteria bacterium]
MRQNLKSFVIVKWSQISKHRKIESQKELDKKMVVQLGAKKVPSWKQFKRLPQTLSKTENIALKILGAVIFVCFLLLVYTNYFKYLQPIPANGGEYSEGLVGTPLYINPLLAHSDVDIDLCAIIYSGLFKYNEKLELVPDLAEKYEVSADQKVYTIYLKKNIKWHDNQNLTASDVVFTYQSAQNPDYKSPHYQSFNGVIVEKIDDYSLKFTLSQPYAAFLNLLTLGILPQHVWYDFPAVNAKLAAYNQKPVGSGPYKFKSLIKEKSGIVKSYTLEKNKSYYGKVPYINKIIYKFYPDYETAVTALSNKETQNLSFLPKDYLNKVNKKDLTLNNINLAQYTALFFNSKNNDLLKDLKIKQALAMALDKNKIIDGVLQGQGQVIDGPILPNFLGYNNNIKKYEYSPQKALELLTGEGWQINGEFLKKKDQELKMTITTVEQAENIKSANLIKEAWNSIGINVDVQIIAKDKIENEIINPRNYQVLLYGEIIGYDPDLFPFWHSSQREAPGLNLAGYANRKVDQLLEEARQTNDTKIRDGKYREFQDLLLEDLPAIFLYSNTYTYPVYKKIKGFNLETLALPKDRLINLENWYIKSKYKFIK